MTSLFWILCAGMAAFALAFVLPPLLRKQPASDASATAAAAAAVVADNPNGKKRKALDQAREAGVLSDSEYRQKLAALAGGVATRRPTWTLPVVLTVLLPFAAFALYHHLGEPRALDPALRAVSATSTQRLSAPGVATDAGAGAQPTDAGDAAAPNMDQAVAGLAERMRNSPDDLDGWMLLGRAYKTMERFGPAREALANAYRLAPDDADVMVEYAEATALASESRRLGGESLMLIERAVSIQPDHQRGLWLLGISHMQAGVPADAVKVWERLLPLMEGDARASLLSQLDSARDAAGLAPRAPEVAANPTESQAAETPPPAAAPSGDGSAPAGLIVEVDIDPALKSKIGASDVLFVYARAAEGPRMPLAIQRLSAGDLPVRVVLDDSTSMMPTMKLSLMAQVVVGARISKSGQATPQSGDLETFSSPMANSSDTPVKLRIDRVVP